MSQLHSFLIDEEIHRHKKVYKKKLHNLSIFCVFFNLFDHNSKMTFSFYNKTRTTELTNLNIVDPYVIFVPRQ